MTVNAGRISDTGVVIDFMTGDLRDATPNGAYAPAGQTNGSLHTPGIGHNSGLRPLTVFEQFEAIVDCPSFTPEQKCILVKLRCRVNSKTMDGAIVSNEGLMRAASLKDPRALRAELRELQGKARELPSERDKQGRPINDPVDRKNATIIIEERRGKASIVGFTQERLHAIVSAYLQYREQKRGPGRPPASDAPPFPEKPPASFSGGLSIKPPASDTGGLEKPPASHAENPLRLTHPDPIPISKKQERGASAPSDLSEADATAEHVGDRQKARLRQEARQAFDLYVEIAGRCALPVPEMPDPWLQRITTRLREDGGLDAWRRMLGKVECTPFLRGENDRGWSANIGWLAKRENFHKVLSGVYEGRTRGSNSGGVF